MDHDHYCSQPSSSNGHNMTKNSEISKSTKSCAMTSANRKNGNEELDAISSEKVDLPSSNNKPLQLVLPNGDGTVDIQVHNMLCNYTLPMHIDLRMVAYHSVNVDYDRARGVLTKQLRNPQCTVKIYNSGKIVIIRCKCEEDCKRAARSIGRMVQRAMNKLNQRICIKNFRVCNILASCRMPFGIRIENVASKYRREGAKYEPELMVGLEWVFEEPKANLRIHTTGSITITGATSEGALVKAVEKIYPFLKEFSCPKVIKSKNVDSSDDEEEQISIPKKRRQIQKIETGGRNGDRFGPKKKPRLGDKLETRTHNQCLVFSDEEEDYEEDYFDDDYQNSDEED